MFNVNVFVSDLILVGTSEGVSGRTYEWVYRCSIVFKERDSVIKGPGMIRSRSEIPLDDGICGGVAKMEGDRLVISASMFVSLSEYPSHFVPSAMISGRLGQDWDLRMTENDLAIYSTSIASNTRKNGQNVASWVRLTAFRRAGEILSQYSQKSSSLVVSGNLSLSKWADKESGEARFKYGIVVDQFEFGTARSDDGEHTFEVPF